MSKHLSGSWWILAITTTTWQHVNKVWELYNTAHHGLNSSADQGARHLQVLHESLAHYDQGQEILRWDDFVFHESYAHHQVIESSFHQASA
jgi:hypothetical protein